MHSSLRICLAQMTSTNRHEGNIAFVEHAAAYASHEGADLLVLPEVAGLMNTQVDDVLQRVRNEANDPFIKACKALAATHNIWIHTGSTPLLSDDTDLLLNQSHLVDSNGEICVRYTKIHLFDIFPEDRPAILESERYVAGSDAITVATPWGSWGMSICYDLRFPHLYRDYARAGATVIFVPSAFTRRTGEAHWEVLLRARAIENGCFIVAAAQCGEHDDGRKTWGHSLVVDPWGRVLIDMQGDSAGLQVIDLNLELVARTREQIPSLRNEREYRFVR